MPRRDGSVREGFKRYACPVCKQEYDVNDGIRIDIGCEGGVPPKHRIEVLKGEK